MGEREREREGEREKTSNLSEVNTHSGLLSQSCIGLAHTVVSFEAIVLSRHATPSLPRWRETVAWRKRTTAAKEDTSASSPERTYETFRDTSQRGVRTGSGTTN